MITGIHHFAIIASSGKSVEFYTQLGFKETFRKVRNYDTVVLLTGHGIELEIFIDPNHPARAVDPENIGLRHLAFKVDDVDEMGSQFACGKVMSDWKGRKFCFTADPDGLPVEFHE